MFRLMLLLSVSNLSYTLFCTNNCSMIYSIYEQFNLSLNTCNYVSAGRCSVEIIFWYERGIYNVTFYGESFHDINPGDNRQFIMIQTIRNKFFSHDIQHVCRESDDCARHFAEKRIREMIKRPYNITSIYSDLERLLYRKPTASLDLLCYDMNDAVRQCTVPGMSGSCFLVDDLTKNKYHKRSCLHSVHQSASVNIYDSGNFVGITVKCNRLLCNGPMTITTLKKILQHHNITDSNDRIPNRSFRLSLTHYLFVLILFIII